MESTITPLQRCLAAPIITTPFPELLIRQVKVPASFDLLEERAHRRAAMGEPVNASDLEPPEPRVLVYIDVSRVRHIEQCIVLELGVIARLSLTPSRVREFQQEQTWETDNGDLTRSMIKMDCWLIGFESFGPIAWIEGRRQRMSWDFLRRFADTAYVPLPGFDQALVRRTFDAAKLTALLAAR